MKKPIPAEQAYDLAASFYDEWVWQKFWRKYEYPLILADVERYQRGRQRGLSLLDVGCGTGWYLENLASLCRGQVGIDVSRGMLAIAHSRSMRPRLIHADARQIPFARFRFDAVICTRVLSHLPRIEPAISEIRRVLSPSGLMVLSDVDSDHDYEFTGLTYGSTKLIVETYKHSRIALFNFIESNGFIPVSKYLIENDGSHILIERARDHIKGADVVGWVASWRRSTG